jgi:hypothetical protein
MEVNKIFTKSPEDSQNTFEPEDETPDFRQKFPRGFAEGFQESILSQESDLTSKNRASSSYSDHLNMYRSKIRSESSMTPKPERIGQEDCRCLII